MKLASFSIELFLSYFLSREPVPLPPELEKASEEDRSKPVPSQPLPIPKPSHLATDQLKAEGSPKPSSPYFSDEEGISMLQQIQKITTK